MDEHLATERFTLTPSPQGPMIVGGDGAELIAADGRRILDAAGGAVVTNVGHGRREVADAVSEAMRSLDYVLPIWPTPNRVALVERLVDEWLPAGFEHVVMAGGGSEANEQAVRIARTHHVARGDHRRHKVIGRVPSYHGATLGTLAIGGHMARRGGFEPMLQEHPKVPWDDADALAGSIEAAGPDSVAAFIAEPVIGAAGGALIAPPDYWATVTEVCRDSGVLVIADEVMTGFGRTGRRWGHEHDDWTPDILVSAKGVGGGYVPLSLASAARHVIEPILAAGKSPMFYTYSAHDASCAGALAVLDIIEREGLVERARQVGEQFLAMLQSRLGGHEHVVAVRGRGLMLGVELRELTSADVVGEALARDVWIYPAGSGPSVNDGLLFAPPLTVETPQLERIVDVTEDAIDAVVASIH